MHSETTLERFLYSDGVLSTSAGISPDGAAKYTEHLSVDPLDSPGGKALRSVGILKSSDDQFILVRVHQDTHISELYEVVLLPREVLRSVSGNIKTLLEITATPLPENISNQQPLDPVAMPPTPTWATDKRVMLLNRILTGTLHGEMLLVMLDAALSERRLLIINYSKSVNDRLDMIEALITLLPLRFRAEVTFVTNTNQPASTQAAIVFSDSDEQSDHFRINLNLVSSMDDYEWNSAYVEHLATLWDGDVHAFSQQLRALELISSQMDGNESSAQNGISPVLAQLEQISQRHQLDLQVASDRAVDIEAVREVLLNAPPTSSDLLAAYTRRLLDHALYERDSQAVEIVAQLMDGDHELDDLLNNQLTEMLESEPDTVYAFIRTHIGNTDTVDERWLPRLNAAAVVSLQVAINDGDNDTLISWLRLIAREPATYSLGDVLQEGIIAAQKRAHTDGELGAQLLTFAVKRAHRSLDMLLDDAELINNLPDPLGAALRDYDPNAVHKLLTMGREISLVVLSRGAEMAQADIFTPTTIGQLWQYTLDAPTAQLPPRYHPSTILDRLIVDGVQWLKPDSLVTLLTYIIASEDTSLLSRLSGNLAAEEKLLNTLNSTVSTVNLPFGDLLTRITHLVKEEILTNQQAIDTYLHVLSLNAWSENTEIIVEQVARLLQQHTTLAISQENLWKMLIAAEDYKSEIIVRPVTRRLMTAISSIDDDQRLIEALDLLRSHTTWSNNAQQIIVRDWRTFVKAQSLTRLQSLERLVGENRALENIDAILETTIAMRKLMGKRDFQEFAEDIATAYNVLQALSDSFDPSNRQTLDFDQATVRTELDSHDDELTPNERNLLAKNLKELAQIVISMADHRSKASLIRREGNIERGLLTGEQSPQSAIDTMKWISGYLSGLQEKNEDE